MIQVYKHLEHYIVTILISLLIPSVVFAQDRSVTIPFNPAMDTPYEYTIESASYINEGFNTQNIRIKSSYKTVFKKNEDSFDAIDTFSQLEMSSDSKMIFSLNLYQEPNSRQQVLKDYFSTVMSPFITSA